MGFVAQSEEFAGRRVLVTGGTRGIGRAIVERFAGGGAKVLTTGRSTPAGEMTVGLVKADMSTPQGVAAVASAVNSQLGGVDIVIHNVGGSSAPGGGVLALSDSDWQDAFNLNLFSATRLDRALLPAMLDRRSGVIIHVSSIQRSNPLFDSTLAYAAAKSALTNYSKGLAKEVSGKGIRVISVAPGYTETDAAVGMVNEIAQRNSISPQAARHGRGLRALRTGAVRRLAAHARAADPDRLGRRRLRVRGQPPHRPLGRGRPLADEGQQRPAQHPRRTTERVLPTLDVPAAGRVAEGQTLRATGAGRNGREHDQAESGRRPAQPRRPRAPRRAGPPLDHPRHHAVTTPSERVETEPVRAILVFAALSPPPSGQPDATRASLNPVLVLHTKASDLTCPKHACCCAKTQS